jgi:demethylmenaquinone methyltransferase/2-methoxy-6-polyprenyl-1,4-benzoquinol methylase
MVYREESDSNSTRPSLDPEGIRRVRRSRERARSAYNRMSGWYDLFAGSERKFTLRGLELLDPQEGERVLEVGFGTGNVLVEIAERVGQEGRVYGIDISEGMCSLSRNKLEQHGLSSRAELHCGDAGALPYSGGEFDAVFAGFTLELFDTPDIPLVLQEWRRVLTPDGRLAAVSLLKEKGLAVRIYEDLHDRFPAALDCRPILLRESLEAAGFRVETMERKTMWGLPVGIAAARNPAQV